MGKVTHQVIDAPLKMDEKFEQLRRFARQYEDDSTGLHYIGIKNFSDYPIIFGRPYGSQLIYQGYMSAEFLLHFKNIENYTTNLLNIDKKIKSFPTFKKAIGRDEYWLKNNPIIALSKDELKFDVRIFLNTDKVFLEISTHPQKIEQDISYFINFLESIDEITITDDDGEAAKLNS